VKWPRTLHRDEYASEASSNVSGRNSRSWGAASRPADEIPVRMAHCFGLWGAWWTPRGKKHCRVGNPCNFCRSRGPLLPAPRLHPETGFWRSVQVFMAPSRCHVFSAAQSSRIFLVHRRLTVWIMAPRQPTSPTVSQNPFDSCPEPVETLWQKDIQPNQSTPIRKESHSKQFLRSQLCKVTPKNSLAQNHFLEPSKMTGFRCF